MVVAEASFSCNTYILYYFNFISITNEFLIVLVNNNYNNTFSITHNTIHIHALEKSKSLSEMAYGSRY